MNRQGVSGILLISLKIPYSTVPSFIASNSTPLLIFKPSVREMFLVEAYPSVIEWTLALVIPCGNYRDATSPGSFQGTVITV